MVFIIAALGTAVNELYLHLLFDRLIVFALLVIGVVTAYVFKLKKLEKLKNLVVVSPICLGMLLIPYFSFAFGRSDFYMRDEDGDFMEGVTVKEVRVQIVELSFRRENEDTWVTMMEDKSMTLYVGQNWAWLGTVNLPRGRFDQERHIFDIECEVEVDKTEAIDWREPPESVWVELENTPTKLKGYFKIREDVIIPQTEVIEFPSFGNPDMGMDITLGEDGYPTKVYAHIFLPEPLGDQVREIELPPKPE